MDVDGVFKIPNNIAAILPGSIPIAINERTMFAISREYYEKMKKKKDDESLDDGGYLTMRSGAQNPVRSKCYHMPLDTITLI